MRTDFYPIRFMNPLAAIGLATQGVKMLTGIGQGIAGSIMLKKALKNRPQYEIPNEFNQNVGLANDLYNLRGISSQYENNFLKNIGRNQAGGLAALNSLGRGSALSGVNNIVQSGNDATGNLYAIAGERQLQNQRAGLSMKSNALNQLAQQKLAKMQWDKFNPYIQRVQQATALQGAGMANFSGGASGIAQIAMQGGENNDGVNVGGRSARSAANLSGVSGSNDMNNIWNSISQYRNSPI